MFSGAHRIHSSLLERAAADSDSAPVATMVVCVWRDIDTALAAVIGHRGVAALLSRSLHLTRPAFPWLGAVQESVDGTLDFTALQTTLSQQTVANAVAANGALLQEFFDLLAHLLGVSLAERLTRPVVDIHSGDTPQEFST